MRPRSDLDTAFAILEDCARRGERCPQTCGPGADRRLDNKQIPTLARAGRILVEISGRNFRRVTILTGPHKGQSTAANPDRRARVWRTIGRQQPPAPGAPTPELLKR